MAEETKYNVPTGANLDPSTSRIQRSAMTTPSLKIQSGRIYEEARKELRFPYCIDIYKEMLYEPTIASATSLLEILISRAEWTAHVPKNAPPEEQKRAEFVNWCIKNTKRDWQDYIIEFLAYMTWGFQLAEKVYTKTQKEEYKGWIGFTDFKFVDPSTISKWIYNLNTGELAGIRQDLSRIASDFQRMSLFNRANNDTVYNDIPIKKLMNFRYNPRLDNPQGNSPLKSCYVPWKHKVAVEDFELIATQKDLGGVPIMGVDVDFLAKASESGSNEQQVLAEMDRQAASFTAGEQSYVRMPIAYNDSGKPLFTFDLLSAGGGGKSYSTNDIITRNENKMLMAFLADVLKLGTESHGSYSLAESKTNLLAMGVEHHLKLIRRTLNHDLIRQLYAINGWEYNEETSVRFAFSDIESKELDVLSKFVQRTVSVGAIRATKELEDMLLEQVGVETTDSDDDMNFIETENNSRSGEGDGTSGTGDSQSGGSNSDNNSDNAV